MPQHAPGLLLAAICSLAACRPVSADDTRARASKAQDPARPGDRRKHWNELNPGKRRQLAELHRRLEKMDPASRARLLESVRAVSPDKRKAVLEKARDELAKAPEERLLKPNRRRFEEAQIARMTPEEQARFRKLSRKEQQEFFRKKLEASREKSVAMLPPGLRERAEKLPPREQMKMVQEYHAQRLYRRVFPAGENGAGLDSRPREEVLSALSQSMKAPKSARPEWIADRAWKRWLELKPFQKALVLKHIRQQEPAGKQGAAAPRDARGQK